MGLDKVMRPFNEVGIDTCQLGQTATLIGFEGRDEMARLAATMINQAEHEVIFYADQLDASLIGGEPVVNALAGLIVRNRSAKIRTLANSSQQLVYAGNRVVELLRSHMPEAACRKRPVRSERHSGTFMIVDKSGYLYLPQQDRMIGSACFYGIATVENLYDVFDQEWQVADADPEMQPLML